MTHILLATSRNNIPVYLNDEKTNVHVHIQENANLLELVKEVITQTALQVAPEIVFEHDMGKVVGATSLVETSSGDEIVFAKRKGRDKYSRFVKGRSLRETSWVVVVIREDAGQYTLWTAWCGRLLPLEAYAENAYEPGGFWAKHALVYDADIIQRESECDKMKL